MRVIENLLIAGMVWLACLANVPAVIVLARLEKAVPFSWVIACSALAFVVTFVLLARPNSQDAA